MSLLLAPTALAKRHGGLRHETVTTGFLRPVRPGASAASVAAARLFSRAARPIPRSGSAAARAALTAPSATGQTVSGTPSLLADFNGVSSRDSAVTNFGAEFEPPDQGLCAGNGYVMEMVNSAYTIYKPDGTVVTGPYNVNGPFDEGLEEFTSDPRCEYDAATHTWYASILYLNSSSTASREDLAVNTSGDPTKPWTDYQIDTTDPGGNGCPCFGDQPTLGIDAYNVYVTTNEFSIVGPQANGAQIYVISKRELTQQGPTAVPRRYVHYGHLSLGGSPAMSVQPALSNGANAAEYFLSSLDPTGTGDRRVGVWAMTNRADVATSGTPRLSAVVIPSETYAIPPGATQKGSTSTLDSGDDRMQQTQSINGDVWGELDTAVNVAGDATTRAGVAWFDVVPTLSGSVLTSARFRRQGYVGVHGSNVLYGALQATASGKAAMVMTLTGAQYYPSAAYAVLPGGGSAAFGTVKLAAAGTGSYSASSSRWGDYSWARLDPSGNSIWMATEYVPPLNSQTPDGISNWGTRVLNLSIP